MRKSILIQVLIASLLTLSMPSAYAIDKCKHIKRMQSELTEKKGDLEKLEAIHQEQVEAKEISDRLMDTDEISEIGLLAEAIDDEVYNIGKEQVSQAKRVGVTIGAVVLSSYIIKRLNKQAIGLKRKFLAQVFPNPTGRRFLRHTLNAALAFSVLSTFWLAYSIKENQDKKQMLAELVIKLNSIKDLTEELIDLREDIDEREVMLDLQLEQASFEGLVEVVFTNDEKQIISCIEKK